MKIILTVLTIAIFTISVTFIYAEDKTTSIINFSPNANFLVIKVKNAKELKAGLENHPLKKIIYNDNTKAIIDELFDSDKKDGLDEETKETKDLEKKSMDSLFASFTGEIILTLSYDKMENEKFDLGDDVTGALIGQVDPVIFQEFIKADIAFQEKSKTKKIINKKKYENIEYYATVTDKTINKDSNDSFTAVVNGIAVLSTNEDTFKKILMAISKNTPIENGLKNNEKIFSYLNTNQNKDVLFTADFAQIAKFQMAKELDGPTKAVFDMMKLDKLLQISAAFDLDEKFDSIDLVVNGLDDGFLQFATITNNEFTPSPFIGADISVYTRAFFSIAELKKKILDVATKITPDFAQQYQGFLEMAKTNFKVDVEQFFDSMSDDIEGFSVLKSDGAEEKLLLNKLKKQSDFTTNFSSIMNNQILKQMLSANFSIAENKEGENQFWVLTSISTDPAVKATSFSLGAIESYAFLSLPSSQTQKYIAQVKKPAESKLSDLASYNKARLLYPTKIALFTYANTKDLIISLKAYLKKEKASLAKLNPSFENLLKVVEDIKAEDFKGSISYGIWKETNKLIFSVKLNNK